MTGNYYIIVDEILDEETFLDFTDDFDVELFFMNKNDENDVYVIFELTNAMLKHNSGYEEYSKCWNNGSFNDKFFERLIKRCVDRAYQISNIETNELEDEDDEYLDEYFYKKNFDAYIDYVNCNYITIKSIEFFIKDMSITKVKFYNDGLVWLLTKNDCDMKEVFE